MRTNSKQVRDQIKKHILECVYSNEAPFKDISSAAKYAFNQFEQSANYPYNLQRIPNEQNRFSDYLCGLPFRFEFHYEGIKDFLNSLGINPQNKEFSMDKSMHLYHYLIYSEIKKALK